MIKKIVKKLNESEKFRKWFSKYKVVIIITSIVLLLLLIFLVLKFYLVFRLLLGYDTVIKLESDKETLFLRHGENGNVTFTASVTINPFCKAECTSNFIDVSNNLSVDRSTFTISPATPYITQFNISSPSIGKGVQVYRFDMDCISKKGTLCHTIERPSTRNRLITVYYDLNDVELIQKEEVKKIFDENSNLLINLSKDLGLILSLNKEIYDVFDIKTNDTGIEKRFDEIYKEVNLIKKVWESGNFSLAGKLNYDFQSNFINFKNDLDYLRDYTINAASFHNEIAIGLSELNNILQAFNNRSFTTFEGISELNSTLNDFQITSDKLALKLSIDEKKMLIDDISLSTNQFISSYNKRLEDDFFNYSVTLSINKDILCNLTGNCSIDYSMGKLSSITEYDIDDVCNDLSSFIELLNETRIALNLSSINMTSDEIKKADNSLSVLSNNIISTYLARLTKNSTNYNILVPILIEKQSIIESDLLPINDSDKLIYRFITKKIDGCNLSRMSINLSSENKLKPISIIEFNSSAMTNIELVEPKQKCCINKRCEECCSPEKCRFNSSLYPIILIHGHAIDKDSSVDFSLEGYDQIQTNLERDGFINAGAINLFEKNKFSDEVLAKLNIPLSFRASYYIDVFKTPENYIAIQAKSENIDTYSIRLKDIIDVVKLKTDKPKVNIIAFSMGGLVARRYIQIFGDESINKLILIGTPNHGIEGRILQLCGFVGESLECRDMDIGSLFINKLNQGRKINAPILNIIGTGCKMDSGIGDGVVLERSAELDNAYNVIINGRCPSKIDTLHLRLRDLDAYPQVYEEIKKFLLVDNQSSEFMDK